jgi:rubrerythrin
MQIYATFMDQQSTSAELVCLWKKTLDEEHNHEQQFLLAKRLVTSKVDLPEISEKELERIIGELNHVLERIASKPLSPRESITLAINIEEKLSKFHLSNIRLFSEESMNRLFESMMKNDKGHVDDLKEVLQTL